MLIPDQPENKISKMREILHKAMVQTDIEYYSESKVIFNTLTNRYELILKIEFGK